MLVGEVRWASWDVGVFLKVVRRQHIVVRRHEHFKEPPGAARSLTQAE